MNMGDDQHLWPAYRLVAAGWCTLGEIDRMTLDEVLEANDALDAVNRARQG